MAQGTCEGTPVLGKHDRRGGNPLHDHPAISPGDTRALSVDQLTPSQPDVRWHSADLNAGWLSPTRYYWIPEAWGHTSSDASGDGPCKHATSVALAANLTRTWAVAFSGTVSDGKGVAASLPLQNGAHRPWVRTVDAEVILHLLQQADRKRTTGVPAGAAKVVNQMPLRTHFLSVYSFSIQKNAQWIWGPGHDPSQITASLWNYSSIQIVHWAVFNFRGFVQFHLPTIFQKTTCISFSTSKSKDAKAARFLPTDNSNSAFPVPNNKDVRPLKDLVPSLPMGKRGQDWMTVHQKTYNTAHYTPSLEALKYAHSKTDFTLCAGGVDEVNYPFNDSMANSLIATKPISLSPSIAWGQNRAQSIIEMFNNPNLRSFYFVPCTDNNYEQAKEDNLPTMIRCR